MTRPFRRTTHGVLALAAAGCLTATGIAHAAPGLQLAASQNLVSNPAFGGGTDGWTAHLYNADVNGGVATVHDSGYVGQDVPVTKGAQYTFSVRAAAADQGGILALALDSATTTAYVSQSVTATAPTTISQSFTAVGNTVYVACQATSVPGGWCGDFSLVQTAAAGGSGSAGSSSGSSGSAGTGSAGSS
ncbi:hypothetical protein JK358_25705 [Nocardia sp. 2]|uniref:CBM-cenC domain-containing protein n=1 Tax=Nocardia acididurans TaxID=2802282 RepID=A0ABS1MAX7_9NOCA|nr:hypothetical protein [Nocardia acididurans]MBL1077803.1 hypothetical protein [Nocardia acididurans]